ncbi:tubulin-specific chaperone D-like isoform X2 [Acanthaster planci]|uniref:Tubulin-specific chaperone D n=1 Tax=Acanthaster planci TaxID=133434 RepID=A0A8B7ZZ62_ACAPL|nr:tubulin-specific chaperone D-like isoform X2 [Acanthaster planci]
MAANVTGKVDRKISMEEGGEDANTAQAGSTHEEFTETEEVRALISSLATVYTDQISVELAVEKFTVIVDKYQEQPHLMDPHLEGILLPLLDIARQSGIDPPLSHLAFKFMYLLTKARGFKTIVRILPHEVADLEPALALLTRQDPADFETWETRYMLLLWMSIICMIPFDMARLDSNAPLDDEGRKREPTMMRIINAAKIYLRVCDKSRDAAALMIAKFLTRHDVKQELLPSFLDWCLRSLTETNYDTMTGMTFLSGLLYTLASLFKIGKREDLVEYAPVVLERLVACHLFDSNNTQLHKLAIKLTQRLGLTFLCARTAAWRYQRGSRSLAANLNSQVSAPLAVGTGSSQIATEDDDEEYDVPEEIEEVIEQLLVGLRDRSTIVRWSAAKGVGRMTGRLPRELADQVVESVLELFCLGELDGAWHGGCLALAELGRRGLLLPERLPEVVPVVLKALAYDEKKGSCSVGAHVRDAACYVCWAFARAYDPQDIKPYINKLASALVITTVFDREVNCRRAASAAFQENVGRQGTFPHGIDILTTADFLAVGNRTNVFLHISCYIADFEEYTLPLIDHLAKIKIGHWDGAIRELTSQALHNLTPKALNYMIETVLPSLIPLATGIDLFTRHGALLAAAEVTHALYKHAIETNRTVSDVLGPESVAGLKQIVKTMVEAKMFRGVTGELLRPAVCVFIEKMSLSKLRCHGDDILEVWQFVLDDNLIGLQRTEVDIQSYAVKALGAFYMEYYQQPDGTVLPGLQDKVLDRYLHELATSQQEMGRMGAAMSLGRQPKFMLETKLMKVLQGLAKASSISSQTEKFAESRRDVIKAIARICKTVGIKADGDPTCLVCGDNIGMVYSALLGAMKDYTTDSRGDVGAWVREASMTSLRELTSLVVKTEPTLITADTIQQLMQCLAQQASEKIDRTRACAGAAILGLLHHEPQVPYIPCREQLLEIFPRSDLQELNWSAPSESFPKMTRLLDLPVYRHHVLLGLTVSVGGLTESLVKHSSQSLMAYLKGLSSLTDLEGFVSAMLDVFQEYEKVDRVTLPMMKMINILLSAGSLEIFAENEDHQFPVQLLDRMKKEIAKCGEPQKLLASVDVFCSMIVFPGVTRRKCLFQVLMFLCHKYPKVRKTSAEKLYEMLLMYDDVVPEDSQEEILTILSETKWDESVLTVRPIRNQLCDLMNIPRPVLKSAKATDSNPANQTELPSQT